MAERIGVGCKHRPARLAEPSRLCGLLARVEIRHKASRSEPPFMLDVDGAKDEADEEPRRAAGPAQERRQAISV
jgi:hypothetical protein